MKRRRTSVGRRLAVLVAAEVATAALLLVLGLVSLGTAVSDTDFMHRFVLVPIQQIERAIDDAASLGAGGRDVDQNAHSLESIARFATHYHSTIQLAGSTSDDARRQTNQLRRAGELELIHQEEHAVAELEAAIAHISPALAEAGPAASDMQRLRASLRELMRINLEFVNVAQQDTWIDAQCMRVLLCVAGLGGIALAALLGVHVRQAIAPRIKSLVQMVKRFQQFGIHERALEQGEDEIAVLANALDVGFAAIAARDNERDRFLANAAHELKTPLSSINGFAQLARANPDQRAHALDVIQRQTTRLTRLVEDLLLAASARFGTLPFHPSPLDLAELTRRVATEVEGAAPGHVLSIDAPKTTRLLADEGLMAHALWALMTCACALSAAERRVHLRIEPAEARVRVIAEVRGPPLSPEDRVRIFETFSFVQYEAEAQPRTAVSLFLCQEIVRIHGGNVHVTEQPGVGSVLTLDLPA